MTALENPARFQKFFILYNRVQLLSTNQYKTHIADYPLRKWNQCTDESFTLPLHPRKLKNAFFHALCTITSLLFLHLEPLHFLVEPPLSIFQSSWFTNFSSFAKLSSFSLFVFLKPLFVLSLFSHRKYL